jgi:hypothetical protein
VAQRDRGPPILIEGLGEYDQDAIRVFGLQPCAILRDWTIATAPYRTVQEPGKS